MKKNMDECTFQPNLLKRNLPSSDYNRAKSVEPAKNVDKVIERMQRGREDRDRVKKQFDRFYEHEKSDDTRPRLRHSIEKFEPKKIP